MKENLKEKLHLEMRRKSETSKSNCVFKSLNCRINHSRIAYPKGMNKDRRLSCFCDMLPLANAAGLRAGVFLKWNGWNLESAIPSLMQPAWMSKVIKISLVLIILAKSLLNYLTYFAHLFKLYIRTATCRAITLKASLEMCCTVLF